MGPHDRRMAIWNSLCYRRQETIAHLAAEHHVSKRTIYYDVEILSLIYPIETVHERNRGGIKIADWYTPKLGSLTPAQMELLLRIRDALEGRDAIIMTSIINQFAG